VTIDSPSGATIIALRPEHIAQGEGLPTTVTRVEHLGDQARLHLSFGNHALTTLTEIHTTLAVGDTVHIRPQSPLFFDASGNRVV